MIRYSHIQFITNREVIDVSETEERSAVAESAEKNEKAVEKKRPDNKKPEKKYNLPRHKFWFGIGKPLTLAFLKVKANFKRTKNDLTERPYMILCNHACDLEPLMVINSVPGVVHALASDHLFKHPVFGKFVAHIASPIPIVRAQMDLKSIKEAMQVRKDGASLLIFPEANCCFSSKTSYIAPATAKLVKQFKMPLALFNVRGSYLTKPRWSNSWRKGRTSCVLVRVIEPEELAVMSVDEIYSAICDALSFNEMEYQRENHFTFKGHDLLDGAERMLYQCPKCGKLMSMKSEGDSIYCTECGYKVTMNSEGFLEGEDVIFDAFDKWDDWQREQAVKLVSEGNYDASGETPVIITPVNELYKAKRAEKNVLMGEGSFALYCDRFVFDTQNAIETDAEGNTVDLGPKQFVWKFDDITKLSCVHKNRIQIAVGEKEYYEIHSQSTYRSAYAYMIYFYCLKRHAQGKELDFFGM